MKQNSKKIVQYLGDILLYIRAGAKKIIDQIKRTNMNISEVYCKGKVADKEIVYAVKMDNVKNKLFVPKDYSGNITVVFKDNRKQTIPYKKLAESIKSGSTKSTLEQYSLLNDILESLENDLDHLIECDFEFFDLKEYTDITDWEFNNFSKIDISTIKSDGLWIGNGIRDIELIFDESLLRFLDTFNKDEYSFKKTAYFDKIDNDELPQPIKFSVVNNPYCTKNNCFILRLDTDLLVPYFEDEMHKHSFYGKIELSVETNDGYNHVFKFDFMIEAKNPLVSHKNTELVAIDFGTSSTCIAKNNGKELISFSDEPETIEDYENMTALIIYNWKQVYNAWKKTNSTIPFMNRAKNRADDIKILKDHFDYADNIKWELENAPDAKTMDAIIAKIKSIPGKLQDNPEQKESIVPFDNFKNKVFLTDNIDDENEETLNPIALYGYLIGRSINSQIKDEIYTTYTITMPVNFNSYQREKIRQSLEYGLKRSLPKTLQDKLRIKTDYEESVALLGAAKKLKYLKVPEDKQATLFAVFDFGGGTLDFAFGLYRKASDSDDLMVFENEAEQYSSIIEIFKTDGELIGGETIIESISYQIYKDNQDTMKENEIPIFVPYHEKKLEPYPASLTGERHIDYVNLKSINENISRNIFIGNEDIKTKIEMFSINGQSEDIELKNINQNNIEELIEEKIFESITNFKNILQDTFKEHQDRLKKFGYDEFSINDIKIFQAGNTCKAKWVKESFELFENKDNIIFISNEKKDITPKNAVAKGALMLKEVGVYNHSKDTISDECMPLSKYIWKYDDVVEDGDEAEPVLKKGDNTNKDFVNIGKRNRDIFSIYYSEVSTVEDEDDEDLLSHNITIPQELLEEVNQKVFFDIWVKPYDGDLIECIISSKDGQKLNESKKFLLNLKNGKIVAKD